MKRLVVRAPAKINLTLRIGPRRADGLHDVQTILQSIALADTLIVSNRPGGFGLACRAKGVPTGRTNLVWKAASALWRAAGRTGEPRDAHVRLQKAIPHAAGLGGGSADAAAALIALNRIWATRMSFGDLHRVAATLGADVPFFLVGGTVLGLGRGDELVPVDDVKRLGVVLLKPAFGVGTADAYGWLDKDRVDRVDQVDRVDRVDRVGRVRREAHLGWPTDPVALINDLEGPVGRRHPEILAMVEACYREGAMAAAMSGSGSAVFGLFAEGSVQAAARRLRCAEWLVLVTRTLNRREATRRIGQ